ncbi:TPA: hypothetical protein GX533_02795 [Candidatus Dojkabacteria bacterium]|uniref:Uncharacterized protein n=1 Tax=Candidatus Dojkabacteria bacterium TaxID=2099670 RepID=A0A832QDS2_9BACT|nr:hypothetical protein [Candidatus Dojkabacteria bacterium]
MKKRDNKQLKKNGYIALTTVLVIIPLLLATGIDLAYRSITNALVSKLEFDHNMLEVNAESCLEESVRKIKFNILFEGTLIVEQPTWTCNSVISNKPGVSGVKIINIQASDGNQNVVLLNKELNTNTDPFEISNI